MDQREFAEEEFETVDLAEYLAVLRERKWVILLSTLVVVAAALAFSFTRTPQYRAGAEVIYQPMGTDSSVLGATLFPAVRADEKIPADARLIESPRVAQPAAEALGEQQQAADLLEMVDTSTNLDTDVIQVTATSADSEESAAVANAFAQAFLDSRRENIGAAIDTAGELLRAQLEGLQAEGGEADTIIALRARIDQLQALSAMQQADYVLVQEAEVPAGPFTPQPLRDGILALAVGLVLGVGLAFLLNFLDRRLKTEEALEREFELPVLASVPTLGGNWRTRGKDLGARSDVPIGFPDRNSPLLEPFRTLRSNLEYYDVDGHLKVLLVTSGLPQQGKTVTSINLALSLALSGQRVVLVEADLRRPMSHTYLGLSNDLGVTNVLSGRETFSEALQLVRIADFVFSENGQEGKARLERNLYCLTSGPVPPNPAELLGSKRMQELLETASQAADYVIVDTPPLFVASDAITMAKFTDGVLVATRVNETTREDAHQIRTMLERANARVIGVVAGGVPLGKQKYYAYGYYAPGEDG